MADDLEPCPFCDAPGELIERHNPMSKWRHSVDCSSSTCGMSGPVEASKAEAIEKWNARPSPALSLPSREDIARVIDPEAWLAMTDGRDQPDTLWHVRRHIASSKADAILSLIAGAK